LLFGQQQAFNRDVITLYQLQHKVPKHAHTLFIKGADCIAQQKYQAALEFLQKALIIDSDYWEAQNDVGFAYLKLDQMMKAEQAFQRAINIDPENAVAYVNLGVAAVVSPDYELAEQSARRALNLNPTLLTAKALLGIVDVGQGHWTPDAHRLLEESLGAFPAVRKVLRAWPQGNSPGPKVIILSSAFH
jgi:superkiller protein 3